MVSDSDQKDKSLLYVTRLTCGAACAAALAFAAPACKANSLEVTSLAPGYVAHSIELGVPFGGAVAQHPQDENILYCSAGNYASHTILEVRLDTGTTRTVTPKVGNVGGLAVLGNGDLAITDNDDLTSDTILRARDLDADGAFFAPGEITELIAPILTGSSFTGAQLAVAPHGNAAGIPAGSLLVQTADGTDSEILVITNPENAPAYYPAGAAWFSGFTYKGGIAFTPAGHVLCGISEFPTGRVAALVNSNGNDRIDTGEQHNIIDGSVLTNSISDIGASADGKLVVTENSGTVRLFNLPSDLSSGSARGGILAQTNGNYISCACIDFPGRPFTQSATAGSRATVYLGGFVTFPAATNLVAITPVAGPASARGWELYD